MKSWVKGLLVAATGVVAGAVVALIGKKNGADEEYVEVVEADENNDSDVAE